MGSFYTLEIARSGIFASQKAMEVTGNNIANANTEGYTRQRLQLSSKPPSNGSKYSLSGTTTVGGGVTIEGLTQVRDKYLDFQFRNENSLSSELNTKTSAMEYIEDIFAEPSEHGINAALSNLYNSFAEVNKNAQDENAREIVVQNAVILADSFKTISAELIDFQENQNKNIAFKIEDVNTMINQIKDVNKIIFDFEISGEKANNLRDKRNLLVDSLSKLIPISAEESSDGRFRVSIRGMALVDGLTATNLKVKPTAVNPYTGERFNEIYWGNTQKKVELESGEIKSMIDIRDGSTQTNQGVPYYLDKLDNLAKAIVENFNIINHEGYTIPFEGNPSSQNVDFFDSTCITSRDIKVSDALMQSGYNIAASATEITNDIDWGNNENSERFNKLRERLDITVETEKGTVIIGNLEEYFQDTISELAINTSYYSTRSQSQKELVNHIDNQRLAVSEVSIDEEMSNLVQYQHTYSAAAKLISAVDEMLDTLINVVGR